MNPTSDTFRTADSDIAIGANTQKQYEALCRAMRRGDLIHDPRFSSREKRIRNEATLQAEIEKTTCSKSAAEWEEIFNAASVPSAVIRSIPEIVSHPHLTARNIKIPVADMGHTLGPGFVLGQWHQTKLTPPPEIGQHTRQILQTLGYADKEIQELAQTKIIQTPE